MVPIIDDMGLLEWDIVLERRGVGEEREEVEQEDEEGVGWGAVEEA